MKKAKASIVHLGGFRPTNEPLSTNFGMAAAAAPGESWPASNGKPMLFICQFNLATAPFVPPSLADLKLITFFMDYDALGELAEESGQNWQINAYPSLDGLVPLVRPAGAPALRKGFECRWEAANDSTNDEHNLARTKIGGYPTEIQSEPWWDYRDHPAKPAYCMQINSEEKPNLAFGDSGAVYLARGTAEGSTNRWFLDWQCF